MSCCVGCAAVRVAPQYWHAMDEFSQRDGSSLDAVKAALQERLMAAKGSFAAGEAFARLDTNNDGVISREEFARGIGSVDASNSEVSTARVTIQPTEVSATQNGGSHTSPTYPSSATIKYTSDRPSNGSPVRDVYASSSLASSSNLLKLKEMMDSDGEVQPPFLARHLELLMVSCCRWRMPHGLPHGLHGRKGLQCACAACTVTQHCPKLFTVCTVECPRSLIQLWRFARCHGPLMPDSVVQAAVPHSS